MRKLLPSIAALAAAAAALSTPLPAQTPGWFGDPWQRGGAGHSPSARVWLDDGREVLRRGDRLRVRFATTEDAYVAVIHIDSDGVLEFLFPASPWDDGYVPGGRTLGAPHGSSYAGVPLRSGPGIGYLYIVASPEPLDFAYFGSGSGRGWDWSYAGREVRGDPFWALEEITRLLVPEWEHARYDSDVYSYHVDGRHQYPGYACAPHRWRGERGWGWSAHYGSCLHMDPFLRRHPGYYDTRLYRGERRAYHAEPRRPAAPEHRYKEAVERARPRARPPVPRSGSGESVAPAPSADRRERPAPDSPSRRRPTLERRGTGAAGGGAAAPRPGGSGSSGGASRAGRGRGYVAPQSPPPASPARRPGGRGGEEPPAPPKGTAPAR